MLGAGEKIKKGLELPITGQPEQRVESSKAPSRVAIMAADYRPGYYCSQFL